MNYKKIICFALTITVLSISTYSYWYWSTFSMEKAIGFEINSPDLSTKILIATQKSTYKDTLVTTLINDIKSPKTYIKVIDVNDLKRNETALFDAVIIIHTWEMWKVPKSVSKFVSEKSESDDLYIIGTSGSGDLKIEGIDGVSSASMINNIDLKVNQIRAWLLQKNISL